MVVTAILIVIVLIGFFLLIYNIGHKDGYRQKEFELKCDEYEQSEKLNVLNSIITPLKDGNLLTVSDDKKIYISKDNGLTWKLLKQEQENEIKV